ncbi:MAG: alpha/beta fold hydrolase [Shimia sp.]|jgi:lysophospholipase|uniref:alpha/beta fold hydrolase n=1 Tax=Shimia sp. TaxID=1954381 RepID=UPI004059D66B
MAMQSAPFHQDVADGPKANAYWLQTSDDVRIRVAHWPFAGQVQDNSRGTVFMFPGRTEYVEKYGRTAADFAAIGYEMLSIDWRGQGLADRLIDNPRAGYVRDFSDYQKDIGAFLEAAVELDLPKPWFVVAHSMGGCIGLRAVLEGLPVKAAVFSGPMWGIMMSAAVKPGAWALMRLASTFGFSENFAPSTGADTYVMQQEFDGNTLTNDAGMYNYMRSQVQTYPDLALGGPSLHWLRESIEECAQLHAKPSPALPCLTFMGSDEQIVTQRRVFERMSRWDNGTLEIIPGGQHEVLMESTEVRAKVFAQINEFFDAHR